MNIEVSDTRDAKYEMTWREFTVAMWRAVDGDGLPEDGEGISIQSIDVDYDAEFVTIRLQKRDETSREVE